MEEYGRYFRVILPTQLPTTTVFRGTVPYIRCGWCNGLEGTPAAQGPDGDARRQMRPL